MADQLIKCDGHDTGCYLDDILGACYHTVPHKYGSECKSEPSPCKCKPYMPPIKEADEILNG